MQHKECYYYAAGQIADEKNLQKEPIFFCVDFDILLTSQQKQITFQQ